MADETLPPYIDTKTVAVAGTPEAITTRTLHVSSIAIKPLLTNTGTLFVVDLTDETKQFPVSTDGIVLPINDPSRIKIDVSVNGEGAAWVAV